jgi:hypothetical protein
MRCVCASVEWGGRECGGRGVALRGELDEWLLGVLPRLLLAYLILERMTA